MYAETYFSERGESIPKLGASQTIHVGSTAFTWGARDSWLMSRMASLNIPTTAHSRRCLKIYIKGQGMLIVILGPEVIS